MFRLKKTHQNNDQQTITCTQKQTITGN